MNPSALFIRRPVATTLLMLAVLLSGLMAWRELPLASLPQVDYPTIQVSTLYPGASPDVMATAVTAPLERQFGQMPGLGQMSSISSAGSSSITLQFGLELALDVAEQQVQAAINAAATFLPTDLPAPPIYNKVNPADAPVLSLAVSSDSLTLPQLEDLASSRIANRISQMSGVGLVSLGGAQRAAVRIQVDPLAAASRGLTLEDVRQVVAAGNVNQAKGGFNGDEIASTIDANDQLRTPQEYERLVLAWRGGAPIRLADIATVADGAENPYVAAWAGRDGHQLPAVIIDVRRQSGANVIETVDRIRERLPELEKDLPRAASLQVLADRTVTIRASYHDVRIELLTAVALVVAVIWVFLRSARATLIPAVTVPLSLVGTLGVIHLLGYSLNNLTLMALTIATGFVVDDAIVMIENIARHIEAGLRPFDAALVGAREIGFTIVSLTISLVAVLIPLLFMGDVAGRLFREFAVTLATAILISGAISLTLTPMMGARMLTGTGAGDEPGDRPGHEPGHDPGVTGTGHGGRLHRGDAADAHGSGFMGWLLRHYARALDVVLAHRGVTLLVALATLLATIALYVVIPKGFFPIQDTGLLQVTTVADQAVSFDAMARRQQQLADAVLQDPAVQSLSSVIGIDGINATMNRGRMLVGLKPKDERDADVQAIMARLRELNAQVPGIALVVQPVQDLSIEDRISAAQFQVTLSDIDAKRLEPHVLRLVDALAADARLRDVGTDLQTRGRQVFVDVDRDRASQLGVTMSAVSNALYSAFGQRFASTVFTQSRLYRVIIEVPPDLAGGPQALEKIYVPSTGGGAGVATSAGSTAGSSLAGTGAASPAGSSAGSASGSTAGSSTQGAAPVALSSFATFREATAPLSIEHLGLAPAATLSFNLAPGVALGDGVKAVREHVDALALPATTRVALQGATLAFDRSLTNLLALIVASIVTMYIVLGILYESYIHPVTILSTLPSAGMGALLALWLGGHDLGVVAVIGLILLIGIVKKNAIMVIDFALDAQREGGATALEAIRQACLLRFRPILMTTLAALLGALPMMLGSGMGSELRRPLGVAMVAGLLVSQLLTLFTTPVIYLAFERVAGASRRGPR